MGALFRLNAQRLDATLCAVIRNAMAPMFDSGVLKPPAVGERYSLCKVAEECDRAASGQGGKIASISLQE